MFSAKVPIKFRYDLEDFDFSELRRDLHAKRGQLLIMLFLFFREALSFFTVKRESNGGYFL
jgi:hypothetical protein